MAVVLQLILLEILFLRRMEGKKGSEWGGEREERGLGRRGKEREGGMRKGVWQESQREGHGLGLRATFSLFTSTPHTASPTPQASR